MLRFFCWCGTLAMMAAVFLCSYFDLKSWPLIYLLFLILGFGLSFGIARLYVRYSNQLGEKRFLSELGLAVFVSAITCSFCFPFTAWYRGDTEALDNTLFTSLVVLLILGWIYAVRVFLWPRMSPRSEISENG